MLLLWFLNWARSNPRGSMSQLHEFDGLVQPTCSVLLNRGAHAPLGGEFEKLRGETLKKGELGVNYTQRGEVEIGQIVWCQLYNTGFLSF